jgi:hypothetical protein
LVGNQRLGHQKYKSQCKNTGNMKKQGSMTSTKINPSTIKYSNDSEVDEILDKELKRMIIRINEEINEYLNQFQQNTNKQLNELRKTMQNGHRREIQ